MNPADTVYLGISDRFATFSTICDLFATMFLMFPTIRDPFPIIFLTKSRKRGRKLSQIYLTRAHFTLHLHQVAFLTAACYAS